MLNASVQLSKRYTMKKFRVVIAVKEMGFNGTELQSDIEITVPAETREIAEAKARRSAEYFARYAGKNVPVPAYTVTEVTS